MPSTEASGVRRSWETAWRNPLLSSSRVRRCSAAAAPARGHGQAVGGHPLVVEGGAQPLLDLAPLGDVPGHDQVPAGLALALGQGRDGQVVDAAVPGDLLIGLVDPGGHGGGHGRAPGRQELGDGLADDLGCGRSTSRPADGLASSTSPSGSSTRTGSLIVRKIWLRATGRRSSRLNW